MNEIDMDTRPIESLFVGQLNSVGAKRYELKGASKSSIFCKTAAPCSTAAQRVTRLSMSLQTRPLQAVSPQPSLVVSQPSHTLLCHIISQTFYILTISVFRSCNVSCMCT